MSDGGAAEFGNRVYVPDYIAHVGDSDTLFGFSGADTYIVNTAGITRLTIDSGGDFMVGNTVVNPASGFANQRGFGYDTSSGAVEVAATSGRAFTVGRNENSDGDIIDIRKESTIIGSFGSNTTGGQPLFDISANSSNGNIRIKTANTEAVRVNSSQNVGIGVTNPYAFDTTATKLHVKNDNGGGNVAEVARFEGSSDASGSAAVVRFGTSNDRGMYIQAGRTGAVPYAEIGTTEFDGTKSDSIFLNSDKSVEFKGEITVKSAQDSSFDEGIGVIRSNSGQTGYINMVGGAMNINAPDAIPIKFRDGGNTNLTIGGDGNATFAGNVKITGNQEKVLELDTSSNTGAIHFEEGGSLRGILGFSNGTTITSSASDNDMVLRSEAGLLLTTNAANVALTLDTSQNATFEGTVNVGTRQGLKASNWGYSSSYKTLILGSSGTNYQTDAVTLAFGVDNSGNSSASFTGNGRELLFRNDAIFKTPNSANNAYFESLAFNEGKVGVNNIDPTVRFEVGKNDSEVEVLSVRYSTVPAYISSSFDGTYALSTFSTNQYNTSDGSAGWGSMANASYGTASVQIATNTAGGELRFFTAPGANQDPTERLRINKDGHLLFNLQDYSTEPTNKNFFIADAASGASVTIGGHSGTHTAVLFRHNGATTPGSISITTNSTSYNTSSDYRLKEDLQDFNGLEKVSNIKVYDFKWKEDESRSYGVMAHELQEVLPQAVAGEKDAEKMQSVDYSKIVPLLVKSIQELQEEVNELKQQCNCK